MHKLRGESATCRCQNHHAPGKAHAMGYCGTAVTILLTGLLSHGLATHNERDTVLLGTLDAFLWNHIYEACKRNHPVSSQDNDCTCILQIRWHSASIHSILHPTLPLLRMYVDDLRGGSATRRWQNHHSPGKGHAMGSCGTADGAILLKELLGHALATGNEGDSAVLRTPGTSLGDSSPHFATEITLCPAKLSCSNDACILESQFHSASIHSILHPTVPLLCTWMSSGVGLPLVGGWASHSEQSTCYGPLWHSSDYHPLEGVAWSQPGYPRGNVLVPCWAPFTCCMGIHLQRLLSHSVCC